MLHERLRRSTRPEGAPLPPIETLRRGEGSCRDIAVLFLAAARSQGFAGRFVSGYYAEPGNEGDFDLHAWSELYVPGGGWRGFDPTVGLAVAERHVSLAVGARPEQAAPVSGSFRGGGRSSMSAHVSISEAGAHAEAGS